MNGKKESKLVSQKSVRGECIEVAVHIRPLLKEEAKKGLKNCMTVASSDPGTQEVGKVLSRQPVISH